MGEFRARAVGKYLNYARQRAHKCMHVSSLPMDQCLLSSSRRHWCISGARAQHSSVKSPDLCYRIVCASHIIQTIDIMVDGTLMYMRCRMR